MAEQRSLMELEKPFELGITGRTKMLIKAMGTFPESLDRELRKLVVNCGNDTLKAALSQGRIADVFIEKTPATTFYALMDAFLRREALGAALASAVPAGKRRPLPVQPKTIGHLLRK